MSSTLLVIARHGNTFERGETPRRIGARTDLPLTADGLAQAQALGRHCAEQGWEFSRCYASPLLRTRQSADAILAAQHGRVVAQMADFLREVDHGPDEGLTDTEIVSRIGAEALQRWDREGVAPEDWVVGRDERIAEWSAVLADAVVRPCGEQWLFVTSNGAARFALMAAAALGADIPANLKLPTGGYGTLSCDADGRCHVDVWGLRP
jgi:broad specificity phosphatase PhoE